MDSALTELENMEQASDEQVDKYADFEEQIAFTEQGMSASRRHPLCVRKPLCAWKISA